MVEKPDKQASQLLDEASHELRTPLNAVLGMLELSLDEPLPTPLRDHLSTAYRSARRLHVVLDDVIDLALAHRGDLELALAPFAFRRTIEKAVAPFAADAKARGLGLDFRIHHDVPDNVHGDAGRLQKLVANMVERVMRMTDAPIIHVEIAVASHVGKTIELAVGVGDDGLGRQGWPQIVRPAAPIDASAEAPYPGGQLALAISQQWVERMNGQMWIDPDDPARLYCTVRLEQAAGADVSGRVDEAEPAGEGDAPRLLELTNCPLQVLVVDDTRTNQKVVKAMLAKRGHKVAVAENGRQAVASVRQHAFDVVLMDAQMPVMTGFEAAKSIRQLEDRAQAQVPIIAMTTLAMQSDRRRCLAAGMDDYLPKPISATALIAAVEFYGNARNIAAPETALTRLGGDEELLSEMIRLFQEDAPSLLAMVRAGCRSDDTQSILRAAHSLRGLAANFDAMPTIEAAMSIERLANAGDSAGLPPALAKLESELARLQKTLEVHQRRRS